MTCDQVRQLLSLEPRGAGLPRSADLRRHLAGCPGCQAFRQALVAVDEALAARPLAAPGSPVVREVMRAVQRSPHRPEMAPPFSRAFWLFSATLTLCALVGGALILHYWAIASPWNTHTFAYLWLNPTWANDASVWLSLQSERAAQVVLPAMAGILVTLVGLALGFRASDRETRHVPGAQERGAGKR